MGLLTGKNKDRQFHYCGNLDVTWPKIRQWYESPLGRSIAEVESELLSQSLANLFGFHLLQVGRLSAENWLSASRVSHCTVMDFPPVGLENVDCGFHGLPEALPVQTDSVDVVVLPHVLEFSLTPHDVLREVDRVLVPEGHVVLLVFNPRCLWSFWRWSLGWRKKAPWCGRFLSTTRIRDWMALLGFDVMSIQGYFHLPPLQSNRVMRRLGFYERIARRYWPFLGAANIIVAKKRVTTLTPIRPRWRTQAQPVVTPGLVEPFHNKDKHVG